MEIENSSARSGAQAQIWTSSTSRTNDNWVLEPMSRELPTPQIGHIIVIYGYEFNRSEMVLKIRDSWPPESGATYVRTYKECLSGSDKYKWEKSIIQTIKFERWRHEL